MAPTIALFADRPEAKGIAIAAAGTRAALDAAGCDVIACDLARPESWTDAGTARLNIVHANPDRLWRAAGDPAMLRAALGGRPTIGYWVWEAPGLPQFWRPWLPLVDSVWVPSSFVRQAVAKEVDAPVLVVPHPVMPATPRSSLEQLGLPTEPFLFLFVFNARSNLSRKNPLGLIRAYCTAFPVPTGETLLVLKTIDMRPDDAEAVADLAGGRPDIRLIDRTFDPGELASLIAGCDCYVSLHRAEGFGLTVAEAMHFARPVICTGYSGVLDFAGADTAYLVDWKLGRLEMRHGTFPAGTSFAEPDICHAAELMLRVVRNPVEASEKARKGAAAIAGRLSIGAVGQRMRRLIEAQLNQAASP